MKENYQVVTLNDFCFIEIPESWTFERDDKIKAVNPDKTIRLTISCFMKQGVPDARMEFVQFTEKWFTAFDQKYKPASEIMSQANLVGKFYNTGNAIEFHTLAYIQPMLTNFGIVTFIFRSTRNLENSDFVTFEAITKSLVAKISDIPK